MTADERAAAVAAVEHLRETLAFMPTAEGLQAQIDRISRMRNTVTCPGCTAEQGKPHDPKCKLVPANAATAPAPAPQAPLRLPRPLWLAIIAAVLIVGREIAVNLPVIAKTHLTLTHANALCNSQLGVFARAFDHTASNDCVNVTIWYTAINALAVIGALSGAVAIAVYLKTRKL